jgi:modification methylase
MLQVEFDPPLFDSYDPRRQERIPFGSLLENGLIEPGQVLYFGPSGEITARVLADGSLEYNGERGSIHQIARLIRRAPCNGWEAWFYCGSGTDQRIAIEQLRKQVRSDRHPLGLESNPT